MELWSWLLTFVGVIGLYLAGSNRKIGWLLGLGAQILWLWYGISTQQYGFVISAHVYGFVYLRNYMRWRSENKELEVIDDE